jgi:hypothetical protein
MKKEINVGDLLYYPHVGDLFCVMEATYDCISIEIHKLTTGDTTRHVYTPLLYLVEGGIEEGSIVHFPVKQHTRETNENKL